jgi:hypothetical protein
VNIHPDVDLIKSLQLQVTTVNTIKPENTANVPFTMYTIIHAVPSSAYSATVINYQSKIVMKLIVR